MTGCSRAGNNGDARTRLLERQRYVGSSAIKQTAPATKMKKDLRILLGKHSGDPTTQYRLAGVSIDTVKAYVLGEMAIAIREGDWETRHTLFGMACSITDPKTKADALNELLVMPGHDLHQQVTREIQLLRSPSSVPYIRRVLEGGFDSLEYTASEDETIAKWFSHALAYINTPEAIDLIREFSGSSNAGIAKEMAYRLAKMLK